MRKYTLFFLIISVFNIYSQNLSEWYSSPQEAIKASYEHEFKDYFNKGGFNKSDKEKALDLFACPLEERINLALDLSLKGYSIADYFVGWCYEGGHGVDMDYKQAFKYFLKAAENPVPFPYALERVGSYYYSGEGIERNLIEAYDWFEKGKKIIKHKDYLAMCMYRQAYIFLNKDICTSSDLESAFNLFSQVSELSNPDVGSVFGHPAFGNLVPYMHGHAAYIAAMLILTQNVHGGNEEEGIKWLQKASELGDDEAQYNLGIYLIHAKKDKIKGMEWINKAATQNNIDALIYLQQSN